MKIHKEGYPTIALMGSAGVMMSVISALFLPMPVFIGILLIAIAEIGIILWFFRIPNREYIKQSKAIISPADGKVVVIEEVDEEEFFHQKMRQISVFMSPLNVHINRYPVSGEVVYTKYYKGKYLVAWHPKSSELNERTVTGMISDNRPYLIKQIAGALARRIVCYAKENTKGEQCEEMGFIKFGSRVDLLIPLDAKVSVQLGDIVKGGITVLATLP